MASDSCSGVSWSHDFVALSDDCGATGTSDVTFTATDACGNAASALATFTIIDTVAPVFADTAYLHTIACDLFDTTTVYGVSATDECSLVVIAVTDNDEISGTCPAATSGPTRPPMPAATSTFEQAVNTIDTVAPTFDFVPEGYALPRTPPARIGHRHGQLRDVVDISVAADTVISTIVPRPTR